MGVQLNLKATLLTGTLFLISGCETLNSMSKEQIGTSAGVIAGVVLGEKYCGDNKKACMTLTAAGFGLLGKEIGAYLDKHDREKMALATKNAAALGQTSSWSNPKNGTSGSAKVLSTNKKSEPVPVPVLKKKVSTVPPLDIIGEPYQAKSSANMRGGPGTDYVKVGTLSAQEVVNVVGKVKTKDWYLISYSDGVGSGFIYTPLLKPASNLQVSSSQNTNQDDIKLVEVAANRTCRTIEQSVKLADGSEKSQTIEACQGPNGWETKA